MDNFTENFFGIAGRKVVVTGGVGLLGSKVVSALSQLGATTICADIQKPPELPKVHFHELDFSKIVSSEEEVNRIWTEYDGIDMWINCAFPRSDGWNKRVEDITDEDWASNVDWHMNKYCLLTLKLCEKMKQKGVPGRIVNVASIFGTVGHNFEVYEGTDAFPAIPYAAIKAGIISFTRFSASLYGPHNIRVNAISPGAIDSDRLDPKLKERLAAKTVLNRVAEPREVANAVIFLISDGASYITGTNLMVDGGWTAV